MSNKIHDYPTTTPNSTKLTTNESRELESNVKKYQDLLKEIRK